MAATSATEIPKSPYSVLFSIPGTKAFRSLGATADVDDEPWHYPRTQPFV